jgi:hypothetical protein
MGPLAILVTSAKYTNLTMAALILSVWTLAGSASQPIWVRAGDRIGHDRVLVGCGLGSGALHAGLAFVGSERPGMVVGALAGLTLPPATVMARTFLSGLSRGERRRRAFGMESALASAGFVLAPLVVGLLHALSGHTILPAVGVLIAAASTGLALAASGPVPAPGTGSGGTGHIGLSLWRITPLIASGAMAYGMLGAAEVLAVSISSSAAVSSILLAAWSALSFLSGLLLSHGRLGLPGALVQWRVCAVLISGCYLVVALLVLAGAVPLTLYVAFCLSGLWVSPLLAAITSEVGIAAGRVFGAGGVAPVYAWFQAASWIGSSAGTSAVGLLAGLGPSAGFALAGVLGLGLIVTSTRMSARHT